MQEGDGQTTKETDALIESPWGVFHVIGENQRPLEQFGEGRHCKSCGAVLSKYNPKDKCWPCQAGKVI